LQAVPITVNNSQRLWVDLRDGISHLLLAGSPWRGVPWDPDEQLVMRQVVRPGDVVLDIGAHIGMHTVLLSKLAGPSGAVHAFEPNPRKAGALAVTVASLRNARLHLIALGDHAGTLPLFVPEDQSMASLADWTDGRVGPVEAASCEMRPLDDLVLAGEVPLPDFVKCDVEGGEPRVFAGARATLDQVTAPIILYEANRLSARAFGAAVSTGTHMLRRCYCANYRFFHVQPAGELRPIDAFDPGCEHFNLLAVPASRLDRLSRRAA
jgi:FkbM family methyltransferase